MTVGMAWYDRGMTNAKNTANLIRSIQSLRRRREAIKRDTHYLVLKARAHGMTQASIASELGVTQSAVSKIEREYRAFERRTDEAFLMAEVRRIVDEVE